MKKQEKRTERLKWGEKCRGKKGCRKHQLLTYKPSKAIYKRLCTECAHIESDTVNNKQTFISWTKGFSSALYRQRDTVITRAKKLQNNTDKLLWQLDISHLRVILTGSLAAALFSSYRHLQNTKCWLAPASLMWGFAPFYSFTLD